MLAFLSKNRARPTAPRQRHGRPGYISAEIVIGVTVVLALAAGAYFYVFPLFTQTKTASHSKEIQAVGSCVISTYRSITNFGTASIASADLINAGCVPTSMIAGTQILNRAGGVVSVTGNGANSFLVDWPGLTTEICVQTMVGVERSMVTAVQVGTGAGSTARTPVVPLANASEDCGSATNTLRITMVR